jgi:hypothetical protein
LRLLDARQHDTFGARVQCARHEVVSHVGYADEGRNAAQSRRVNRLPHTGEVERAVLHVEDQEIEPQSSEELHDIAAGEEQQESPGADVALLKSFLERWLHRALPVRSARDSGPSHTALYTRRQLPPSI